MPPVEGIVTVPPLPSAIVPPLLSVTVPPLPSATVPPLPSATVPPLPSATVPPLPSATVPPLAIVIVPALLKVTLPPLPNATVPPLPSATVPPLPKATVPPAPMFNGAEEEPNESTFARDANSPPVAPTWRRSMPAWSLYPRMRVFNWPSKLMSWPFVQAGVIGAMDASTRYAKPPFSGVPSQCMVAGAANAPDVYGTYQAEVGNVAALFERSVS